MKKPEDTQQRLHQGEVAIITAEERPHIAAEQAGMRVADDAHNNGEYCLDCQRDHRNAPRLGRCDCVVGTADSGASLFGRRVRPRLLGKANRRHRIKQRTDQCEPGRVDRLSFHQLKKGAKPG